jgi:hypothetical protein
VLSWGCGDTAGHSVGSRGISEDSRRRGYFGETFQNGGYFKGLPIKEMRRKRKRKKQAGDKRGRDKREKRERGKNRG